MTIVIVAALAAVAQAVGFGLALRMVRFLPDQRLPGAARVPREFTSGEWRCVS